MNTRTLSNNENNNKEQRVITPHTWNTSAQLPLVELKNISV